MAKVGRRYAVVPVLALLLTNLAGCSSSGEQRQQVAETTGTAMPQKTIEQVLAENTQKWMALPGVVGTGISSCDGQPCLTVFVVHKDPELEKQIPAKVDGYRVQIEITGEFKANR